MTPKVSICVPNLNTRPYLPARFESIFNQTFQDWELIVYDSYSDDGAWEYIQELAKQEPRMKISQGPREGIYPGWNACVQLAQGEYVYIATSDDTMRPDCLEKMVKALDAYPQCDLAHCCLDFIDEEGKKIGGEHCWETWSTTRFLGEWNNKYHIRPQGHDTVVALGLRTTYYSVTQLLIRRKLFDRAGLFERKWGPFCDLEWQMRAALMTQTLHIPEYLATWRFHPQQASQMGPYLKAIRSGWFFEMADAVINFSKKNNLPSHGGLPKRLRRFYWNEWVYAYLADEKNRIVKSKKLFAMSLREPFLSADFFKTYLSQRFFGQKATSSAEKRMEFKSASDVRKELSLLRLEQLKPIAK